jgi:hypothetical protein
MFRCYFTAQKYFLFANPQKKYCTAGNRRKMKMAIIVIASLPATKPILRQKPNLRACPAEAILTGC